MKKKILVSIIGIALVVSVGFNIYQLNSLNNANAQNKELQNTIAELQASISNYEAVIADNEKSVSDLKEMMEELQSENELLSKVEWDSVYDNTDDLSTPVDRDVGTPAQEPEAARPAAPVTEPNQSSSSSSSSSSSNDSSQMSPEEQMALDAALEGSGIAAPTQLIPDAGDFVIQ